MSFFSKKLGPRAALSPLATMVQMLQSAVNSQKAGNVNVARSALSLEHLDDGQVHALESATGELNTALEAIAVELGIEKTVTRAQIDAATAAGIFAGDINSFLRHDTRGQSVSTESMSVVNMPGLDGTIEVRPSMEAYDERENRNAAVYSITYNMQAARQDEFGEAFFPTIVVTPDNVGFGITVRLMMVYNELQRNISGALDNYEKKNIIRALADPTILKNEMTRIVPVVRAAALDKFVAPADVAPRTLVLEGESIVTAPLAVGKKLSLLGISQTDTLLNNGMMDVTDSIDPGVTLQYVYVKVGDDVLQFNVTNLPFSNFTYTTQNNYRVMTMNFDTTSILLNKNTKRADGSPLTTLAAVATSDLIVRLSMNMSGTINIETSETGVYGNHVGIHSVQNAAGELLALTAAPASDLVTLLNSAAIIGYELQAYRTNANRRQRGQLIDTTEFTQLYNVPLRNPITAIHPMTMDGQTDAGDLASLITATRIRTSNSAVGALINAANLLREYTDARDYVGTGPDVLGVGRFFVRPTYFEETIDMVDIVDSIKSHERAADIQAALVSKIRDHVYRMYRDSEYKAAADARAGGLAQVPTVIIGTDPVLARYLTVPGDLRTLGGEFDVRIVSTLDRRVAGKIFLAFGVFDENRNVEPNPLGFGNMAWSPELTIVLPISRNGQISKELAVSPRYLHVTHCPVMAVLIVENVPDVLNKISLHTTEV